MARPRLVRAGHDRVDDPQHGLEADSLIGDRQPCDESVLASGVL